MDIFVRKQSGAVSIEFAVLFPVFFLLFYGVVGYSVPFLLAASYQEVAADALREGIHHPDLLLGNLPEEDMAVQRGRVRGIVEAAWMPAAWRKTCDGYSDYLKVQGDRWSVCLRHDHPEGIIAPISLLGWKVPRLPAEIRGEASIDIR